MATRFQIFLIDGITFSCVSSFVYICLIFVGNHYKVCQGAGARVPWTRHPRTVSGPGELSVRSMAIKMCDFCKSCVWASFVNPIPKTKPEPKN